MLEVDFSKAILFSFDLITKNIYHIYNNNNNDIYLIDFILYII